MNTRLALLTVLLLIFCICCSSVLAVPQNFVVGASELGASYSLLSKNDGTFFDQVQIDDLNKLGDYFNYSFSTGIGDFDNDGDYDYIVAAGPGLSGNVYLYNNTASTLSGPVFSGPFLIGTWNQGTYVPSDMAVADFNADGNLDFIVTHSKEANSELYLGDGELTFTRSVLTDTEPHSNIGTDAADVNNDGKMDFVVVPWYWDQYEDHSIYINLGKGDGNFIKSGTIPINPDDYYWGCALADITGDDNVDLVATTAQRIDIFLGDGKGNFDFLKTIDNPNIGPQSPIDNYDFNVDGKQDLVIGNYGALGTVAVLLGDNAGNFAFKASYPGVGTSGRENIAAAPYIQGTPNTPPVACVKPASKTITAGEWVCFDACCSKDPDGKIVSYKWAFGDGSTGTQKTVKHRFTQPGVYSVTVTVTDDKGATATATSTITVSPIKATVECSPQILNLKGEQQYVTATISLPKPYDVKKINIKDVAISHGNSPVVYALDDPKWKMSHHCVFGNSGRYVLVVKFYKDALADIIPTSSRKTVLHVSGTVQYGDGDVPFDGYDTIWTFSGSKYPGHNGNCK